MLAPYLGIGQLAGLQRGHVAAQPKLLAVQALQILFELQLLRLQRVADVRFADDAQLQVVDLLQFVILYVCTLAVFVVVVPESCVYGIRKCALL